MADATQKYLLSEGEKQQYRGLLIQAFDAANAFNGSEETYEHLMTSLISMDTFVRQRNENKMDEAQEKDFAEQSGFKNANFNTISSLLGHASEQVYGMLSRLKNLKEMLNALSIGGAYIDYSEMVYVLTDEAFPAGGENQRENLHDFLMQPRLAILVKELQTIGIYTDDLIVRVGKVFEDKIRKLPYVIVEIPRLGKQVAVCDQYGETTFVSQNILEPYIWASYTKKQLKEIEGVKAISFGDKWPFTICNLLAYGTDSMTPAGPPEKSEKINVAEYERLRKKPKMKLNEDIILNHMLVYLKKYKSWPMALANQPIEGLEGERWQAWNSALVAGTRGLPGKSSLWQLVQKFVAGEAKLHKEKHGFLPGLHAGELTGRPDITWDLIGNAVSLVRRGDLNSLYTRMGLIKKRRTANPKIVSHLTPDIIMHHALARLKETWHWPDEYDLNPIPGLWSDYGHKNGEYWNIWNYYLWEGGRGLPGGSALHQTIWGWVKERALEFQKERGRLPDPSSGKIEGYPGISWDMVDHGLRTLKGWKYPLEDILKQQFEDERKSRAGDFTPPQPQ